MRIPSPRQVVWAANIGRRPNQKRKHHKRRGDLDLLVKRELLIGGEVISTSDNTRPGARLARRYRRFSVMTVAGKPCRGWRAGELAACPQVQLLAVSGSMICGTSVIFAIGMPLSSACLRIESSPSAR